MPIAAEAKNFYTQFPDSTNSAAAKTLEVKMSRRAEILYRMYRHLHAPGNPLDIKFTALDGRKVDLSQMKGRVVLVEFWATWCPGCVAEIPQVKEVYDKFHPSGFDVIGISFDSDKKALTDFVQKRDLPWPQYFDGKADASNKFSSQYGIEAIPVLWLADKNGVLRETKASENLQAKVEKLLAE